MTIVEGFTTIPAEKISLKIVDDTMIRRIDRQVRNAENPNIKNTIKDVKVIDGTVILIEVKDDTQVE